MTCLCLREDGHQIMRSKRKMLMDMVRGKANFAVLDPHRWNLLTYICFIPEKCHLPFKRWQTSWGKTPKYPPQKHSTWMFGVCCCVPAVHGGQAREDYHSNFIRLYKGCLHINRPCCRPLHLEVLGEGWRDSWVVYSFNFSKLLFNHRRRDAQKTHSMTSVCA